MTIANSCHTCDLERGYGIWQVRRNGDDACLGWVLIRPMGFNSQAPSTDDVEIGWRFKREYWGRGYATELL
ncbi:GNAT family N-acetyltransferase [Arsukibacterium sp.]|uniref:GNAT family N-acetyltransferase n=1 Tax=Arsukibacterium sp. TaxID=1977258 RepID=UPI0039A50BB3